MKYFYPTLACAILFVGFDVHSARAETLRREAVAPTSHSLGVGLAYQSGPGITIELEPSSDRLVQTTLSFPMERDYYLTGDYGFAYPNAIHGLPSVTPYIGFGGIVLHDDEDRYLNRYDLETGTRTYFGARLPFGFNWHVPRAPIQLGAELAPSMLLVPASYGFVQGDVHVRVLM